MTNVFEQPTYEGAQALSEAIERDDVERLQAMIVAAALYEQDLAVVQAACMKLSAHRDEIVRGNALLGFGHLARIFGELEDRAVALVADGLRDRSAYVRGQAHAAAGDLKHFLGVDVRSR
jgi:hypothetical protein